MGEHGQPHGAGEGDTQAAQGREERQRDRQRSRHAGHQHFEVDHEHQEEGGRHRGGHCLPAGDRLFLLREGEAEIRISRQGSKGARQIEMSRMHPERKTGIQSSLSNFLVDGILISISRLTSDRAIVLTRCTGTSS